MSGTSLDAIDAVLVAISPEHEKPLNKTASGMGDKCQIIANASTPYSDEIRQSLLDLHTPGENELHRTAILANQLATLNAETVHCVLAKSQRTAKDILAIGYHGQTLRHQPACCYTMQIGNPSLLAELTGIQVVADFRSRDLAAGGQGAPLVPAFHEAVLSHPHTCRGILNIGGIANLTVLDGPNSRLGFDTGPGNLLMDAWIQRHQGVSYDHDGAWAMQGNLLPDVLHNMLTDPYFAAPPPKSTGRDHFNMAWLNRYITPQHRPVDVQRTLLQLTTTSIAKAVTLEASCPVQEIYVCGGGAMNNALIQCLRQCLSAVKIDTTEALGIMPQAVEAAAFAWLARQRLLGLPGNLAQATGARGARVLGAIYAC